MFGEFQKLQKICNKMSTRIFKIDGEMPEIIEPKVGNPQNSTNQNLANLSQPWNLTFLEDEIFQLFFQSYVPKVPEWKIAHIEWSNKVQNIRKSPKNEGFRGTYCIPPFWEHPVVWCAVHTPGMSPCWRPWRRSSCPWCRWSCSCNHCDTTAGSSWSQSPGKD